MDLEQQCCSLELAKKLEELGVKQESLFSWCDWFKEGEYNVGQNPQIAKVRHTNTDGSFTDRTPDKVAAFTVAELGSLLPDNIFSYHRYNEWVCGQYDPSYWAHGDTEADARCLMLIYLLENKLI